MPTIIIILHYLIIGYSEGSFRANDATFTSGGQCEDGLKMIFVIGQATVPPVGGGGGDDSGVNQDGGTGQPLPDKEGRELTMITPLIMTLNSFHAIIIYYY